MAQVKLTCGKCGSDISPSDKFCASCGERVELPVGGSVASAESPSTVQSPPPKKKFTFRPEPWQMYFGGALVLLLGYFIYSEIDRPHVTPKAGVKPAAKVENHEAVHEIEQLEQAVNANPNDAAAVLRLANKLHDVAMTEQQLLGRAISTYQQYLKLNPDDPNARVDLGICYFEQGRTDTMNAGRYFQMAIDEMETTIEAHPTHQSAAFNLGIVTLYAGAASQSTRWFQKAVEINPESDLGKRAKNLLEQHSFQSSVN